MTKFTIAEKGLTRISYKERIQGLTEACYDVMRDNEGELFKFSELLSLAKKKYVLINDIRYSSVDLKVKNKLLEFSGVVNLGGLKLGRWGVIWDYVPAKFELSEQFMENLKAFHSKYKAFDKKIDVKKAPDPGIIHFIKESSELATTTLKYYFPERTEISYEGMTGTIWILKFTNKFHFMPQ